MEQLIAEFNAARDRLRQQPDLAVRGALVSTSGNAMCALAHVLAGGQTGIVAASVGGAIQPLVSIGPPPFAEMTQTEAEIALAERFKTAEWVPVLLRILFDFDLDPSDAERPMSIFGAAAPKLQQLLATLAGRSRAEWAKARERAADEFRDAGLLARNEAAAARRCLEAYDARIYLAAQVLCRDVARRACWNATAERSNVDEPASRREWNIAWVACAADLARRAAIEVLARASGASDVQPYAANLLGLDDIG